MTGSPSSTASEPAAANPTAYERAVVVGAGPLTIDEVVAVARGNASVTIPEAAWERVAASRAIIDGLADDVQVRDSSGFTPKARR